MRSNTGHVKSMTGLKKCHGGDRCLCNETSHVVLNLSSPAQQCKIDVVFISQHYNNTNAANNQSNLRMQCNTQHATEAGAVGGARL